MISSQIESLLFLSSKPLTAKAIHTIIKKHDESIKLEDVRLALETMYNRYKEANGGISLIESAGQYQLVTNPENAVLLKSMLKDERTGELTQPSLETLTIIAYRGPIAKPHIEEIRGVNCSMILRNLLIRGLVIEENLQGESLFSVTPEFLQYIGMTAVTDLPDYEKLHSVDNLEEFLAAKNNAVENEKKKDAA